MHPPLLWIRLFSHFFPFVFITASLSNLYITTSTRLQKKEPPFVTQRPDSFRESRDGAAGAAVGDVEMGEPPPNTERRYRGWGDDGDAGETL